jgi:hypothetical protein
VVLEFMIECYIQNFVLVTPSLIPRLLPAEPAGARGQVYLISPHLPVTLSISVQKLVDN